METKKRATKGITLIALVVTIVVLLILAGVSINLLIGNNGIITKAGDAKRETELATQNDLIGLNNLYDEMDSYINGSDGAGDMTLVEAFNEGILKVGDYVTYTPDSTKSYPSPASENGWADQTYTVDTNTQWRVLGTEGNQVLLISADPIKKDMNADSENSWDQDPYLYMKGAYSYVNCVSMLDNICGIYSTSLGTAKSITADNINNVLGVKVESDKVYFESDPSTNIDMAGTFGKTYTYTSEDYSPESYINGKNHATEGEIVPKDGEAYAYGYDYTGTMATTIGNTTIGSLLFEGTQSGDKYAKSYWLASPGARVGSGVANFGPGRVRGGTVRSGALFDSVGYWNANRFAVRPVVYLNSDVTVEQIQKTTGKTETWSYDNSSPNTGSGNASNGEAGNHGN